MVQAEKRVDSIDRAECRRWIEQRFSIERMVNDYETIFRRRMSRQPPDAVRDTRRRPTSGSAGRSRATSRT